MSLCQTRLCPIHLKPMLITKWWWLFVWVLVGSAQRRKKQCSLARQTCAYTSPCCRLTFCHDGDQSLILFSLLFLFLFFSLLLFSIFCFFILKSFALPSTHFLYLPFYLFSSCPVVFHCKPIEGLLPESHWDSAQLCGGMEQPGLCV